jgi:hypothetical protein
MTTGGQNNAPKIIQASDLVTFYANGARIVESEYELRIYFSEQAPPDPSDSSSQPIAVEKVCIIMAPKFVERFVTLFYELGGPGGEEKEINSYK